MSAICIVILEICKHKIAHNDCKFSVSFCYAKHYIQITPKLLKNNTLLFIPFYFTFFEVQMRLSYQHFSISYPQFDFGTKKRHPRCGMSLCPDDKFLSALRIQYRIHLSRNVAELLVVLHIVIVSVQGMHYR